MARNKYVGRQIDNALGHAEEVSIEVREVEWGKFMRLRVKLDITKPLLRKKKICIGDLESVWVRISYERLPYFCFNCGIIRHSYRDCPKGEGILRKKAEENMSYGNWLRAEQQQRNGYRN